MRILRVCTVFFLLIFVTASFVVAENLGLSTGEHVTLEAKQVEGEVYIKASSLLKTIGGSGDFDSESGSFTYKAENRIANVVEKMSPSVVAIIGRYSNERSPNTEERFRLAHGTGIVVKSDGWIVTNAHVVKNIKNIVVVSHDGKQYSGTLKHIDEESDLALIKVDASDLQPAVIADKLDVQVGETVVAIGTPISFALRNTVTVGVVSGVDRSLHSTYRLLQTDAAINPGNSGGALVNLKGEVIGINSLKYAAVGIESLGFAIPADTVHYVINHFMQYGKVKRANLGFDLEESWAALVGLPTDEPLKVTHISTSAASSGIQKGDVLYSVDNVNVKTIVDLNEHLKKYLPGQTVHLMMQSNGDLLEKEITLIEQK